MVPFDFCNEGLHPACAVVLVTVEDPGRHVVNVEDLVRGRERYDDLVRMLPAPSHPNFKLREVGKQILDGRSLVWQAGLGHAVGGDKAVVVSGVKQIAEAVESMTAVDNAELRSSHSVVPRAAQRLVHGGVCPFPKHHVWNQSPMQQAREEPAYLCSVQSKRHWNSGHAIRKPMKIVACAAVSCRARTKYADPGTWWPFRWHARARACRYRAETEFILTICLLFDGGRDGDRLDSCAVSSRRAEVLRRA